MSQSTDALSMLTAATVAIAALGRAAAVIGVLPASVETQAPAARCAAMAASPAPWAAGRGTPRAARART